MATGKTPYMNRTRRRCFASLSIARSALTGVSHTSFRRLRPQSLADARSVARSASNSGFSPALRADQQAAVSKLNQSGYPRRKKRSSKKRSYTLRPKPDDPECDVYIESLPPVQREKYLASFR